MKHILLLSALIGLSSLAWSTDTAYGKLFIGTVDTFRDNQDTQYGIEYQWAEGITRYDLKNFVGIIRTRDASHFLYNGLSRTSKFTEGKTGLALNFAVGQGLYFHGGGNDTDLGFILEFRTSAGLLWIFEDNTRIGVHFSHLSNASIVDTNPGTELITFTYELPF